MTRLSAARRTRSRMLVALLPRNCHESLAQYAPSAQVAHRAGTGATEDRHELEVRRQECAREEAPGIWISDPAGSTTQVARPPSVACASHATGCRSGSHRSLAHRPAQENGPEALRLRPTRVRP